jgi:drug/metabolite transporter (DMT)-like permease
LPTQLAEKPSAPAVAYLYLVGAVLLWGTSFLATKTALDGGLSPMTVVWLRMVIAALAIAPFWSRLRKPQYQRGDLGWIGLICLLQSGIYYLCENYAMTFTTSSQAGMISAIVPLLVGVGAWLFLRERLSALTIGGIGLSVAGVIALSLGAEAAAHAPNPALGNALEVAAMFSAAGSMLAMKHIVDRYDPWMLTGFQAAFGAVFFLPGALLSNPATWMHASAGAWIGVVYLGIGVSLGAFGLYAMALHKMPASRAAIAINAVPLVALLAGWAGLHETLGLLQVLGCVAIAAGVALGQLGGGPAPEVDTGLGEGG